MDHNEVREILEDAAIEPQGLERLMAGDTSNGALVAGHLAACLECTEELSRLHRSVGVIRPLVRTVPPPELRERTLAYVRAVGRPRGAGAAGVNEAAGDAARAPDRALSGPSAGPSTLPGPGALTRLDRARRRPGLIPLGLVAALIVAVAGTGVLVNADRDAAGQRQSAEIEALANVARTTLQVDAQPDARRIALKTIAAAGTTGTIVFSQASRQIVVVAEDLARPPAGREYRCWIEIDGRKTGIGKMYFAGDLAYWVGDTPELAGIGPAVRFGVSLVDLSRPDIPGEPVLIGEG